ncbi:hypothetical protein TcasGA2_TC008546 [Tribolium castaneum]|uniref:Integrase catalytic domain-containing protein n=1 Tax=Tribolium castaneum TaxID=7070 RepID=D7EI74_TRICA|nr:hypothetical protein TcasGA2_TC008546 [Tribolium castaneum]
MDRTFALFGIVKQLQSANGPPFNSHEITDYCQRMIIKHKKVTPYWPEANGRPERFVKTLKKTLTCSVAETNDMSTN